MGVLRSCHFAPARAYLGGPEVVIRWYFADPAAPLYAAGHVWEPICYRKDRQITDDSIGELPNRRQPYYRGANTGVRLEAAPCGTAADYRGEGTVPRLPNGQIDFAAWCDCAYRPCIGFEVRSHPLRRFVGELLQAGEWSAAFNPDGAWHHTAFNGMTWTRYTDLDVQWSAADSLNCGGVNDSQQIGQAWRLLTVTEPMTLTITLTGRTERENEMYDIGQVLIDSGQVLTIHGTEEALGCTMAARSATVEVALTTGTHRIDFNADTVDEQYHVGAFWRLVLTLDTVIRGDLVAEGEWSEIFTVTASGEGEVLMEGEWSANFGTGSTAVAELLAEGEWEETPPAVHGDGELLAEGEWGSGTGSTGVGELLAEGEWEETPPAVHGDGELLMEGDWDEL